MIGMTKANNTLGLVIEEDGTQTIECRRGEMETRPYDAYGQAIPGGSVGSATTG